VKMNATVAAAANRLARCILTTFLEEPLKAEGQHRITEGHDCQAKRRRCGENRRGATFLKGCCRAATQRSVTLTNASCPVRVLAV
jgi:hypothetical protein